jgi:CHAD domain-containing protein
MVPKLSKQCEVLRRLCLTRIETARTALAARAPGDTAIHRARQHTKRARALLHLLRDALGKERVLEASHALRDVNRALAGTRDAAVLAGLLVTIADDAGVARRAVRSLQARLEREVDRHRSGLSAAGARRALTAVVTALNATPMAAPGAAVLGGFLRIYRNGRRGYATAMASPRAAPLHAWRKHVTRYWYVLEVLSPANPRLLRPLAREAHRLAELLGDHNDRSLLAARLRRASLPPPVERALLRSLASQCATLRTDALAVGARLYGPPPKRIAGPVEAWWKEWPGPE